MEHKWKALYTTKNMKILDVTELAIRSYGYDNIPNFGRFSRDAQSRQTNSRWIGSRPISIKTPNNTSENTTGGSHLHTTKRRGCPDVLSLPLSFCLSHALFYDIAFMTVYAQCTPKSWTLPSENHANNSSIFYRTSHRNLIRTRRSPIIIGIV